MLYLLTAFLFKFRYATAVEGLHLIVGDHNLVGVEELLSAQLGRERRLTEALAILRPHYDLIMIDTAPSMNIVSVNALTASDGVLIRVQTEYLALEGVALLMGTIQEVRRLLNNSLGVDAVIMTMHSPTLLNTQVAGHLRETFGDLVLDPPIRRNIRLAESPSQGVPIRFMHRKVMVVRIIHSFLLNWNHYGSREASIMMTNEA